ncbi:MAG: tetratricopeptide repeat protein [Acidobacteriota bacterium]
MSRKLVTTLILAALIAFPATLLAEWEAGINAFKGKNYAEAARQFEEVTQTHPEWPDGFFWLGQSLEKLNRKSEALQYFQKAYDLKPDNVSYQLQLGNALVKNSRYGDAATLLKRINPSSLPKAQQGIYHKLLAASLNKSGQSGQALAAMKSAAEANPRDAAAWFSYGAAAFNDGQTNAAVNALAKAVQLDGKNTKAREAYVDALMRQGRETRGAGKAGVYKKAVTAAQALASRAGTFDNFLTLGEAQLGAKDYGAAVASFEKAVGKKGNDWLAHYYLSQAATSAGNYARASDVLAKAMNLASSADQKKKVYDQLGFVYEKEKKLEDALKAYQQSGNQAGQQRVANNIEIRDHNEQADDEEAEYARLKAEEERLQRELEALEGGG